jgi:hypothetical protein
MAEAQGGAAAFQAGNSVGMGFVQAAALRSQADYQKKVAELNNKTLQLQVDYAEEQSADAVKRGGQAANKRGQKERLDIGARRAAIAAAGGDPSSAAALTEIGDMEAVSAADQVNIQANAFREAFGYKSQGLAVQGEQLKNTFQARTGANALEYAAKSSMITGITDGIAGGASAYGKSKANSGSGKAPKKEFD